MMVRCPACLTRLMETTADDHTARFNRFHFPKGAWCHLYESSIRCLAIRQYGSTCYCRTFHAETAIRDQSRIGAWKLAAFRVTTVPRLRSVSNISGSDTRALSPSVIGVSVAFQPASCILTRSPNTGVRSRGGRMQLQTRDILTQGECC